MTSLITATVLEVGEYVTVPYAGKLLSDLGAEVIKLEPPSGDDARRVQPFSGDSDPDASGFFGYLNTGKRSVILPESEVLAYGVIQELIEEYEIDIVLDDGLEKYGINSQELADAYDSLSVISLTGFGATGPWQEYNAPDIVAWAESGHMNKMGYPDSPPVRPRIKIADYWAGQVVAIGALGALSYCDLQDGQGQWVDVSKREAAVSTMDRFIAGYAWSGATTERSGSGYPAHDGQPATETIYEAADGYIAALPTAPGKWEVFCREFLERPELIDDERFETRTARRRNREKVSKLIEEFTAQHDKSDLFERFQEAGIASGITSTPEDLTEFQHLHERDFWQRVSLPNGEEVVMPGFPFRPGGPDHTVEMERAPCLGEHTTEFYENLSYDPTVISEPKSEMRDRSISSNFAPSIAPTPVDDDTQPLDNIRILDFSWVYAGPHASKHLAALGADVIKVESKQKPDSSRSSAGYQFDLDPTSNISASYNERNQGKRSLRLDLTNEEGQELALELIREADIVMENYSPTFLEQVNLSYERMREVNPGIVYLSMPGIAKSGPAKDYRAYGLTLQSMVGLDHISGYPDDPPTTSGFALPDPTAGYMGVIAALSGLHRRERTDEGIYIELPQLELAASLLHKPLMEYMIDDRMPERTGARDEDHRFLQGVYSCRGNDCWVVIAIENHDQWEQLCDLVGRPNLVDDERFSSQYSRLEHHDEIDELVGAWTRDRSREEARQRLRSRGIPAGIVADERDLMEYDPQLRAREYFTSHDHPEIGTRRFQGVPFSMQRTNVEFGSRAPLFGEHTEEVLKEWLGYTNEDIERKEQADALY